MSKDKAPKVETKKMVEDRARRLFSYLSQFDFPSDPTYRPIAIKESIKKVKRSSHDVWKQFVKISEGHLYMASINIPREVMNVMEAKSKAESVLIKDGPIIIGPDISLARAFDSQETDEVFALDGSAKKLFKELKIDRGGDYLYDKFYEFCAMTNPDTVEDVCKLMLETIYNSRRFLNIQDDMPVDSAGVKLNRENLPVELFSWCIEKSVESRLRSIIVGLGLTSTNWIERFSVSDVHLALEGVNLLTSILALNDKFTFKKSNKQNQESVEWVNVVDSKNNQYTLKFFSRPFNDGKGEARFSFELYLDNLEEGSPLREAFTHKTIFIDGKVKEQPLIRFSFDLDESRGGQISFDMGRNDFKGQKMDRRGDYIGNILDQIAIEGHHDTFSFEGGFSYPKEFALLATAIRYLFALKTGVFDGSDIKKMKGDVEQLMLFYNQTL